MANRYSVIVLLSVVCFKCFSQNNEEDSSCFPLNYGNEWSYSYSTITKMESVVDTTRINGRFYFGIKSFNNHIWEWCRVSGDTVFVIFNGQDSTESILLNFAAGVNDSWDIPYHGSLPCRYGTKITLLSKSDTVTTSAGTFFNCYRFTQRPNCIDAGTWDMWFAKGIGKVKYLEDDFSGFREFTLNSFKIITFIVNNSNNNLEHTFALFHNYPNPFNSETVIQYHVQKQSHIKITVFDLLAREVDNLVDEQQYQGQHKVTWNAGKHSSGIYFISLRNENIVLFQKVLLLK